MFFDKDKKKEPEGQPESKDIWNDLKNAEVDWCCKFLQEILAKDKMIHLYFVLKDSGEYTSMKLNFCPRCGRELLNP